MKYLILCNSIKVSFIDDDLFEWLSKYKWRLQKSGYAVAAVKNGKGTVYLHVFLLGLPCKSKHYVDHIDRNPLNNQRSNLRVCTQSQNLVNKSKVISRKHYSKYKGVAWSRPRQKWIARISYQGTEIYGGGFDNEIEAACKADDLYLQYFGEFAQLNFKLYGA